MTTIETIRSYRIFGIALFDLVCSYVGVFIFHKYLVGADKPFRSTLQLFFAVIPFGVLVHMLFGQHTFLNTKILDDPKFNLYKVFFLISTALMFLL